MGLWVPSSGLEAPGTPFSQVLLIPLLFLPAEPTPAGPGDACLSGPATAMWDLVPGRVRLFSPQANPFTKLPAWPSEAEAEASRNRSDQLPPPGQAQLSAPTRLSSSGPEKVGRVNPGEGRGELCCLCFFPFPLTPKSLPIATWLGLVTARPHLQDVETETLDVIRSA